MDIVGFYLRLNGEPTTIDLCLNDIQISQMCQSVTTLIN